MHAVQEEEMREEQLEHHHLDVVEQEELKFSTEEEMKEWFWDQHKDEILTSMKSGTGQKSPLTGHNEELDSARKSLRLLDFIAKVQRQFLQQEEVCVTSAITDVILR
jgi:hypothetical protein